MVIHLNYIIKNSYNTLNTGTICGVDNKLSKDGTNSSSVHREVTCKKCLAILKNTNHWRYIKFVEGNLISKTI